MSDGYPPPPPPPPYPHGPGHGAPPSPPPPAAPGYPPQGPPPPGYPPPWQQPRYGYGVPQPGPPPEPPKPKRTGAVIAVVASVALFFIGVGVVAWATFGRDDGPSHPDDWDSRVDEIAQSVQTERGVLFEHPVHVDFLTAEEFEADVTSSEEELTDEDRAEIDQAEALFRALGLVEGEFDLFEQQNQLTGEGTLAYYDTETERIRVKGTEMTPALEVTLAHELTHALQDQFVDLDEVRKDLSSDDESRFRAVVEGDAVNVQEAYAAEQLTAEEYQRYVDESSDTSDVDIDEVPPALVAFFQAPYVIGPSFDEIVKAKGGSSALNTLLSDPPTTDRQLLDPRAYFDGTSAQDVEPPAIPEGASAIDDGEFGALEWYVVMAARIDPVQALDVIDNWAGDQYATYEQGGKVCVAARYVSLDPTGAAEVQVAFDAWIMNGMAQSARLTEVDDRTFELVACDPGADASTTSEPAGVEDLLGLPAIRLQLMANAMEGLDDDLELSWCAADGVSRGIPRDRLTATELSLEDQQAIGAVMASCAVEPG